MLAWSSPAAGAEVTEFHRWYEEVHIPQISALLPVVGKVERFVLALEEGTPRYLAIYDLGETLSPSEAAAVLGEATAAGKLTMSPAMDLEVAPPALQFLSGV
jgi:hypothetical protein